MANKEWSGEPPRCVRKSKFDFNLFLFYYLCIIHAVDDCGILPTPLNGRVDFKPNTSVRSIALFSCIRGYKLVGSSSRKCQNDGQWSSSQPKCQSKFITIDC